MKRIRWSPLNLLSALLLAAIAYLWLFTDASGWRKLGSVPLIGLLLLCLVSDILFRLKLKDLKRIWIVEGVFIIFVLLMSYLIQIL